MRRSESDALDNALARRLLARDQSRGNRLSSATTQGGAGSDDRASDAFRNPMTSAGDLITGGAYGAPVRLGPGADGQVLTVQPGGALAWATAASGSSGGSYRQFVVVPDGSAGFAFLDDGAGNPVMSLEATE